MSAEPKARLVEISPGMWVDPDVVFAVQRAVDESGAYKLGYSVVLTRPGLQMVPARTPDEVAGIVNGTVREEDLGEPAPEVPLEQVERPKLVLGDQRLDGGDN